MATEHSLSKAGYLVSTAADVRARPDGRMTQAIV
jgi:hypothetical protein